MGAERAGFQVVGAAVVKETFFTKFFKVQP
jgi:hypothetical protein